MLLVDALDFAIEKQPVSFGFSGVWAAEWVLGVFSGRDAGYLLNTEAQRIAAGLTGCDFD